MRFAGLLAALLTVHFLGDFTPLSRPWMLKAKSRGWPPVPIAVHALVHAFLTTLVFLVYNVRGFGILLQLFLLIFVTHFVFDTLKGLLAAGVPATADVNRQAHWVAFGIDQLFHQLVIIIAATMATTAAASAVTTT